MLVLHTPKGWTGPGVVDGVPVEGTWRSHQVPLAELAEKPEHLRLLEEWMRSYRPRGALHRPKAGCDPSSRALAPAGQRRMSDNPHANGGMLLRELRLPDFREYAVAVEQPGASDGRGDAGPGRYHARRHEAQRRERAISASSARTSSPRIAGTPCWR